MKKRFIFFFCLFIVIFEFVAVLGQEVNITPISEKVLYKNRYQTINTDYVTFDLPLKATHYWENSGLDKYEVIISNFSIKNNNDYVLRATWYDDRYIDESLQIHYEFKDGKLAKNGISFYSLSKYDKSCMDTSITKSDGKTKTQKYDSCIREDKSKLKFINPNIEIGELIGYKYRLEINTSCDLKDRCPPINVSYPVYSWSPYSDIQIKEIPSDFIAIDDINVSTCATLSSNNSKYLLEADITDANDDCFQVVGNNITFDLGGYTIDGDETPPGRGIYGIDVSNITISNGVLSGFDYGVVFYNFYSPAESNFNFYDLTINDMYNEGIAFVGDLYESGTNISNINVTNVNITNGTYGEFGGDYDLYLFASKNILIQNSSFYGIELNYGSYAIIQNSSFYGIELNYGSYATATNSSYIKESLTFGSNLTRKWFFSPQVNFTHNGTAVSGANVTGLNVSSSEVFEKTTDANGRIPRQELIEYFNNNGAKSYSTNYTFNVELTGWDTASQEINLTTNYINQQFNISDTTAPSLTIDEPEAQNYADNNTIYLNYSVSDTGVGVDACWYNVFNSTSEVISNTTITNCLNTTFGLVSGDEDYVLSFWVNDTINNIYTTTVNFGIRTDAPSVVLNHPTSSQGINNGTDVYFNFTATDTDGLGTCQLWGNWTGSWALNYTWESPTSGVMNWTQVTLNEGWYKYNVWCNDSLGNGDWAIENKTFLIDETTPVMNALSITTTANSNQINFTTNITDNNLGTCQYSIWTGSTPGTNTTFTCNSNTIATAPGFGTYNLYIYVSDLAGNTNQQNMTFTTSISTGGTTTGGGNTAPDTVLDEGWKMSASGGDKFEIIMSQQTSRNFQLEFENVGDSSKTITLSCEDVNGSACSWVSFEEPEFQLALLKDTIQIINFGIDVPREAEIGKYQFNLKGVDEDGREGTVTVFLTVKKFGSLSWIIQKIFYNLKYAMIFIFSFLISFIAFNKWVYPDKFPVKSIFVFVSSLGVGIFLVFLF